MENDRIYATRGSEGAVKSSDMCMILGFLMLAPHANSLFAASFAIVMFGVATWLRGDGK